MSPVVNKLRKEFNEELNQLKSDMKSLPVNNAVPKESDQKKTTGLVLKNLPERRDENIVNSVNTFIKDGLKLDIKIKDAERKRANQSSECGIVVVSCNTKEDKYEIMKCKATLKQNATYKNIYIEHDLTPEERNSIANLKTIAKVIGNDKLYVKGNRLVQRTHNEESRDAHEWQEVRHRRKTSPHQVRTRSGRSDHRRRDETFTRRHDTDRTSYRHEHQSSRDRHETRHRDHARDTSRRHQGYHDGEDRRNYTHVKQSKIIHDRQNIPEVFMNNHDMYELLKEKINLLEADRDRQEHIDNSYTEFLDILNSQMKTHLNPREINLNVNNTKNKRVNKPWWNEDLSVEWKGVCVSEKLWLNCKIRSQKNLLKTILMNKRKLFDKNVKRRKRAHWHDEQSKLLKACENTNKSDFWKDIGKIGIGSERNKSIPIEVLLADGSVSTLPQDVLNKWKNSFEKLYNVPNINNEPVVIQNNLHENTLNTHSLNDGIHILEIDKAVN
ncbi:hypothetical protein MAR_005636, partial [Mya arenaria]